MIPLIAGCDRLPVREQAAQESQIAYQSTIKPYPLTGLVVRRIDGGPGGSMWE